MVGLRKENDENKENVEIVLCFVFVKKGEDKENVFLENSFVFVEIKK